MDSGTPAAIIAGSRCVRLVCLWSQKMTILAQLPHHPARTEEAALAALVMAIGGPAFATQALAALNAPLQAASWSVYRVWRDRAPALCLSASHGVADTTQACFAAYSDGLYRWDRSFDLAHGAPAAGSATVLQMRAEDAPTPEHRERIYRRHGLLERLSVVSAEDDGGLLAVNLYHHAHQGAFSGREREQFVRIAPLLLAGVRRHLALLGAQAPGPLDRSGRAALQAACAGLTARELDVCERLLRGWSHDGVAADLGLSVATVKTYRTRAFRRLGLHFRSELFARFGTTPAMAARH
jgi:DNA-binding NarL/FixJ family response regulator